MWAIWVERDVENERNALLAKDGQPLAGGDLSAPLTRAVRVGWAEGPGWPALCACLLTTHLADRKADLPPASVSRFKADLNHALLVQN
jgi:hypothetical protein